MLSKKFIGFHKKHTEELIIFIFLVFKLYLYSSADIQSYFLRMDFFFSVYSVSIILFHEVIDLPKKLLVVKAWTFSK